MPFNNLPCTCTVMTLTGSINIVYDLSVAVPTTRDNCTYSSRTCELDFLDQLISFLLETVDDSGPNNTVQPETTFTLSHK